MATTFEPISAELVQSQRKTWKIARESATKAVLEAASKSPGQWFVVTSTLKSPGMSFATGAKRRGLKFETATLNDGRVVVRIKE